MVCAGPTLDKSGRDQAGENGLRQASSTDHRQVDGEQTNCWAGVETFARPPAVVLSQKPSRRQLPVFGRLDDDLE